jgi:hypothetical protein
MKKLPEMTPVDSSNIQSLGHDPKIGLVVRFKGGGLYRYPGVPKDVYEAAIEAQEEGRSVGLWFQGAIRGVYNHEKVDG